MLNLVLDELGVNELKKVPSDLNSLQSKVNDLNVKKLKTDLVGLNKIRNIVDNDVVKLTAYNE